MASTATRTRKPQVKPVVTTVVGSMGTRTTGTAPQRPTRPAKAAPKATPKASPKAVPATRTLPRDLLVAVATWASQAKLSAADQQRVANYLKVVTSGTDPQGARYWPAQADLPKGVRPLPRPTHHSWAKRS